MQVRVWLCGNDQRQLQAMNERKKRMSHHFKLRSFFLKSDFSFSFCVSYVSAGFLCLDSEFVMMAFTLLSRETAAVTLEHGDLTFHSSFLPRGKLTRSVPSREQTSVLFTWNNRKDSPPVQKGSCSMGVGEWMSVWLKKQEERGSFVRWSFFLFCMTGVLCEQALKEKK